MTNPPSSSCHNVFNECTHFRKTRLILTKSIPIFPMETFQQGAFTLKQIFQENWDRFLTVHQSPARWQMTFNIWKIISCRDPGGLGFATFASPDHPGEICQIPRSCKSRFCSARAKVQVDKLVTDMGHLFPNCPYFHVTFTVPSQFQQLLHTRPD